MLQSPTELDTRKALVRYAGLILNRRPYLSGQLTRMLEEYSRKHDLGDTGEIIASIIFDLKKAKYLDDSYLIKGLVRRELEKGHGPQFIRQKLFSLKVSREDAELALEEIATPEKISESIQKIVKKIPADFQEKQKLLAKLFLRGFSSRDLRSFSESVDSDTI